MAEPLLESNVGFLAPPQQEKLSRVLTAGYEIVGRGLPTLSVRALDFTRALRDRLVASHIPLAEVRLNGSAASYVVSDDEPENSFNDLDVVFLLADEGDTADVHALLEKIRAVFFTCLHDQLPDDLKLSTSPLDAFFLQGYIQKMFKVPNKFGNDADAWSLIALNSESDRNLEYKFVLRLRRQYEFTVDSIQITLDLDNTLASEPVKFTCLSGPVDEVLRHVNNREISMRNPELVRGGGLLKYCNLRAQGYRPEPTGSNLVRMELYMCNRFLIDFSSPAAISVTLYNYFIVRLRHKETLRHDALLNLQDLLQRCRLSDRCGIGAIVDNMLHQLSPVEPLDTTASLLSSLRPSSQRSDSPTSSIDSKGSYPTEGSSTTSTSSNSDAPGRPWSGRPFAAVAALPARVPAKTTPSASPAPAKRAPLPNAPERGSSAPSSPGTRRRDTRVLRPKDRRDRQPGTTFQLRPSQFPALPTASRHSSMEARP